MNRLIKLGLLLLCILPFGIIVTLAILERESVPGNSPFGISLVGLLFFLWVFQWIIYIYDVFKNKTIAPNNRIIWLLLLIWGNLVVFPIYWYFNVWKPGLINQTTKTNVATVRNYSTGNPNGNLKKYALLFISLLPIALAIISIMIRLNSPVNNLYLILGRVSFVLLAGLIVYYVIDVHRNNRVGERNKLLWSMLLIFGNAIVFPFYWFVYVRPSPPRSNITIN